MASTFYLITPLQWDVLSDSEAVEIVAEHLRRAAAEAKGERLNLHLAAATAANELVDEGLRAGTLDNVTAVVGLLKWE